MNPEDDPEARIRQLEQPLADRARASELGGPGGYSPPFSWATPRSSSGSRVFWILAAVFIIGVLVVAGGIAFYAARQLHQTDFVQSPGPSTSKTRTPRPGPSTSTRPAPGAAVTVSGMNENKTIACNENTINVSGISNTVVISGHCVAVKVSGLNNIVTVDAAGTIAASGLNNKVTYHSGSPKISKSGNGNVIEQG